MNNGSIARPEYPRPQMVRDKWINLNGKWQFEIDMGAEGFNRKFFERNSFESEIIVPFCPESSLSGVNYKGFMNCVWYKRGFFLPDDWAGKRVILHFGAVDYLAHVWINKEKAGTHRGGYTSFSFDITPYLKKGENIITLAAYDEHRGGDEPRGKQSDEYFSYGCLYTRTTGIWQTVWLEAVDERYITNVKFTPDAKNTAVTVEVKTSENAIGSTLFADVSFDGEDMGKKSVHISSKSTFFTIDLKEAHLWDIGEGNLYDVKLKIENAGQICDEVLSYFGLRSVALKDGAFFINDRAVFGRWVLDQGFYPDGIYTAPTDDAFINDIKLSFSYGFNGARLHQKIFDPRFLYHADRMGYPVWEEHASWGIDHTSNASAVHFIPEWLEAVERDYSHPCIIGWCPLNETWDDSKTGKKQEDLFVETIYKVTKAADPTRPVIDTSGNYHVVTDIFDVHDYTQDEAEFLRRFGGGSTFDFYSQRQTRHGEPFFVSEYGGFKWPGGISDGWGYGDAPKTEEEFFSRYKSITGALLENENIFAFCYTQLTDVEQEQNGLAYYNREPKFDPKIIYDINTKKAAIEKKFSK